MPLPRVIPRSSVLGEAPPRGQVDALCILLTAHASVVLYHLLYGGGIALGQFLLGRPRGDISVGIVFFIYGLVVFPFFSLAGAAVTLGGAGKAWQRGAALLVGLLGLPVLTYLVAIGFIGSWRHPNWTLLVLASTALGLALPNIVAMQLCIGAREGWGRRTAARLVPVVGLLYSLLVTLLVTYILRTSEPPPGFQRRVGALIARASMLAAGLLMGMASFRALQGRNSRGWLSLSEMAHGSGLMGLILLLP